MQVLIKLLHRLIAAGCLLTLCTSCTTSPGHQPFTVHQLYGDHAVLQRNTGVPFRGTGSRGAIVTVTLAGRSYKGVVAEDGAWEVVLPPQKAGGPYVVEIRSEKSKRTIRDVYFGDVWLCSGQSNMAWKVKSSAGADIEIPKAGLPALRHFKVPAHASVHPARNLKEGKWEVSTPATAGDFTAIGYYFAREIHQREGVPVGLLNASWGSSQIRAWMSAKALKYTDLQEAVRSIQATLEEKRKKLQMLAGTANTQDPGIAGQWYQPSFGDSSWQEMELPGYWEVERLPELNGVVWFRKTVELPPGTESDSFTLHAGRINDSDITWVNGQKVGGLNNAWNVPRVYKIPPGTLRPGNNVLVIRVEDPGQSGGVHGRPGLLRLESSDISLPLAGPWKYRVGALYPADWERDEKIPARLFNGMIQPLCGFPVKGVLWYQGESNTRKADAIIYDSLFVSLIRDWRHCWRQDSMPFIFAQLANIGKFPNGKDDGTRWELVREAQAKVADRMNHTAQVVTFDISEPGAIHPRNKKEVGKRMAIAARKLSYGEDVICSGPVFDTIETISDTLWLQFRSTGSGLKVKGEELKGFEVAGADGLYHKGNARLSDGKVTVWCDAVPEPRWLRYAWGRSPVGANLYNMEGLPAVPFRIHIPEHVSGQ